MWSRNTRAAGGRLLRGLAVAAAAALTAGCFQPLYGEHTAGPGTVNANVRDAFATVEVDQIAAPNGTPEARIAVEVRNNMIWELTGGAGAGTPNYRLGIKMTLNKTAISPTMRHSRCTKRPAPCTPSSVQFTCRSGGESESMNQRAVSAP